METNWIEAWRFGLIAAAASGSAILLATVWLASLARPQVFCVRWNQRPGAAVAEERWRDLRNLATWLLAVLLARLVSDALPVAGGATIDGMVFYCPDQVGCEFWLAFSLWAFVYSLLFCSMHSEYWSACLYDEVDPWECGRDCAAFAGCLLPIIGFVLLAVSLGKVPWGLPQPLALLAMPLHFIGYAAFLIPGRLGVVLAALLCMGLRFLAGKLIRGDCTPPDAARMVQESVLGLCICLVVLVAFARAMLTFPPQDFKQISKERDWLATLQVTVKHPRTPQDKENRRLWACLDLCTAAQSDRLRRYPRICQALVSTLKDEEAEFQALAVVTVGLRGDVAAVGPLIECLRKGPPEVRPAAAIALGRIGDDRASDALRAAAERRDLPELREAAQWAIKALTSAKKDGS